VFARRAFKQGDLVGLYGGYLLTQKQLDADVTRTVADSLFHKYLFNINVAPPLHRAQRLPAVPGGSSRPAHGSVAVDASCCRVGNPLAEMLDCRRISSDGSWQPGIKRSAALLGFSDNTTGKLFVAVIATSAIASGAEVCVDYGEGYWRETEAMEGTLRVARGLVAGEGEQLVEELKQQLAELARRKQQLQDGWDELQLQVQAAVLLLGGLQSILDPSSPLYPSWRLREEKLSDSFENADVIARAKLSAAASEAEQVLNAGVTLEQESAAAASDGVAALASPPAAAAALLAATIRTSAEAAAIKQLAAATGISAKALSVEKAQEYLQLARQQCSTTYPPSTADLKAQLREEATASSQVEADLKQLLMQVQAAHLQVALPEKSLHVATSLQAALGGGMVRRLVKLLEPAVAGVEAAILAPMALARLSAGEGLRGFASTKAMCIESMAALPGAIRSLGSLPQAPGQVGVATEAIKDALRVVEKSICFGIRANGLGDLGVVNDLVGLLDCSAGMAAASAAASTLTWVFKCGYHRGDSVVVSGMVGLLKHSLAGVQPSDIISEEQITAATAAASALEALAVSDAARSHIVAEPGAISSLVRLLEIAPDDLLRDCPRRFCLTNATMQALDTLLGLVDGAANRQRIAVEPGLISHLAKLLQHRGVSPTNDIGISSKAGQVLGKLAVDRNTSCSHIVAEPGVISSLVERLDDVKPKPGASLVPRSPLDLQVQLVRRSTANHIR
jgi:hypothetical protein